MRNAFNAVMRVVSSLIGLLMIVMGCVWAMQGLNIGPAAILQGPMVANMQWTYYGAILALIGVAQIVWSNTRQGNS
jgi:hypothetical protein